MGARFSVGIDLGTTNSVIACVPLDQERAKVELVPIPQLTAPATVEARDFLPSFLYLGTDAEAAAGHFDTGAKKKAAHAVGAFAQRQAADVPARTIASAKSWLCNTRVDRRQPILPWGAPAEVPKMSPVEASRHYLEHLAAAWKAANPKAPLAQQEVVLTLPASFDASARELTREAALAAGLPEGVVLLEEPQAALYAWLAEMGDRWRRHLKPGDRLLVCDVGGGTTDLTLIDVAEEDGQLLLKRVAVGNHTLVGGDNMDLALAHFASAAFAKKGVALDPWQSVALWHSCRVAKEAMLRESGPAKHPVTVLGRGAKVIGGTVSVDLEREAVAKLLLDGFFPACALQDAPERMRAPGFKEIGLPFETDTAITRHIAAFLTSQGGEKGPMRPTHVLFNGGVFKAAALRERLLEVIDGWFGGRKTVKVLEGVHDLEFSVAKGAAYYGAVKKGKGVRIRGGTARSYYVGIETTGPAIPGALRPVHALCVVPFGMEEGTEADVPGDEIGLAVGEPAHFRFFSSAVRKTDAAGALLTTWKEEELSETDSMEAQLPRARGQKEDLSSEARRAKEGYVPVRFHVRITELGVLELSCVGSASGERWKLEFSVRRDADQA